ncbi:Uncharacterized protein Fot_11748 [Forsythia ovata]|uniref:BTB domain-containing protein n=1 Tax=Forsythia ovata TaxID=205694 RepID=A0ABD1WNE9_9LAMI
MGCEMESDQLEDMEIVLSSMWLEDINEAGRQFNVERSGVDQDMLAEVIINEEPTIVDFQRLLELTSYSEKGSSQLAYLGSNSNNLSYPTGYEVGSNLELSRRNPCGCQSLYLAARSPFFHDLFKNGNGSSVKESKPKYLMSQLVPHYTIEQEAFKVLLTYLYSGKLKPSPPEVSTCVDESCTHVLVALRLIMMWN